MPLIATFGSMSVRSYGLTGRRSEGAPSVPIPMTVLMVAGGGAGGSDWGGGGGAGGLVYVSSFTTTASQSYTVAIGAGAPDQILGVTNPANGNNTTLRAGGSPVPSVPDANKGGGGGNQSANAVTTGQPFGSGGGGGGKNVEGQGAPGTAPQGFPGGNGSWNGGGAGGGGAGGVSSYGGPAGPGTSTYDTLLGQASAGVASGSPSLRYIAGGGGPSGANGGGGNNATPGTANTGGGGGNGINTFPGPASQGTNNGRGGGSGIVIFRYDDTYPDASATTGSPTRYETGGYKLYKFTGDGSITW